jgi:hypothetical protein
LQNGRPSRAVLLLFERLSLGTIPCKIIKAAGIAWEIILLDLLRSSDAIKAKCREYPQFSPNCAQAWQLRPQRMPVFQAIAPRSQRESLGD